MIAYCDCFSGISGDMILGALIDLGFPLGELINSLEFLNLSADQITARVEERKGLKGIRVQIKLNQTDQKEKNFPEIKDLIEKSSLPSSVKERSIAIFYQLAQAEALVHRTPIEEVHFHEVGAVDSIIDIVGSVVGINYFNIDKIIASPLPLGRGFVHCKHGTMPLPAPATLEILKGIPVYGDGTIAETVTPTGAAIIATLAQSFGSIPLLKIEKIGYGLGEREDQEIPNLLRIILGNRERNFYKESLVVIETNIDDLNPEFYDYVLEILFSQGALDVFLVPVQMKKNRPGVILKVIAKESNKSDLIRTIFRETTTLGVRVNPVERFQLGRQTKVIETPWGKVRIKLIEEIDGNLGAYPEYEDCKKIAREKNIPLKQVFNLVNKLINP